MKEFFSQNLDFLYFFYGAAFFLLGVAGFIFHAREKAGRPGSMDWLWLGVFGFSHAINEWLDLLSISYQQDSLFISQRLLFLTISFVALGQFAISSYSHLCHQSLFLKRGSPSEPSGLFRRVGYFTPYLFFAIGLFLVKDVRSYALLVRCLLGLPASLSAAFVFWVYSRRQEKTRPRFVYRFVSVAFFLYAFLLIESGVYRGEIWQVLFSPFLHWPSFRLISGIPLAFYRSLIVTVISFLLIHLSTKSALSIQTEGTVGGKRRRRFLVFSFLVFYLLLFFFGYRLLSTADRYEKRQLRQLVLSDARNLADIIGMTDIRQYVSGEDVSLYKKTLRMHNRMTQLADLSFYAQALYLVTPAKDGFSFIVGSVPQVFPYDVSPSFSRIHQRAIADAFYSKHPTFFGPFEGRAGRPVYTLFFPVVDERDTVLVLLGMEVDASRLQGQVNAVRLFIITICMLFLILLVVGYAFLIIFALKSIELLTQKNNVDKALLSLRETQRELARSEETFRGILNNSPNAIFGFDRDLRLIFWNHGAERLYGYEKADVINEKDPLLSRRITDVLGLTRLEGDILEVFQGKTLIRELSQKNRAGENLEIAFTVFPVKDPQGHILFALGLAQDISTHKRYEERLADAHAQLKSVLDGAPQVSINATDLQGHLRMWNRGSEEIFGYKSEEIIGRKPDFWHDEADLRRIEEEIRQKTGKDLKGFEAIVETVRQGGILQRECLLKRRDGRVFLMDLTIAGLHNDKGDLVGYIGIGVDMSGRQKAEQELKESQRKYKDLVDNLNIGVFVATPEPGGKIIEFNNACLAMLDADTPEEMNRLPIAQRYRDPGRRAEISRKIMEQGYVKNEEAELVTSKGRTVWASYSAVLREDESGQKYFYGVIQDITDRKKLEQSVLEERDRLKKIADSIGAGLSLIDRDFNIIWVNEVLERWFGKNEKLRGRKCFETYQFRDEVCEKCPSRKAMETGEVQSAEQRSVFSDGRVMDFLLICTPVKNERGEVVQVLELTLDITERKRMVEMLEFERALSRNVIDSISDSLLVLDCDSRKILDANRRFLEQNGRKKEDVVGKKCSEVDNHGCRPCEACSFQDIKAGRTIEATHIHRLADGREVYIDVTLSPLKDEKGKIIGIIHISRDVTDRKRMEDELKRYSQDLEELIGERSRALQVSELMFRNLFESAQDGILIVDAQDGHIINANPFLLNMLECAREDLMGRHYADVPFLLNAEVYGKAFHELKDKAFVFYDEALIQTCKAKPLEVELRASTYFVEKRKIIQFNIRDITERKKIDKVKTEFVSMVSHELRTPLSAIKEGVEIVADETQGKINKSQKECLGIALSNIKRLNRLIGDILDISKIQTNLLKVHPAECHVYEIAEQVYNLVKIEIEKRGLVFVTDCPKSLPSVWADRDRLLQVLMNLVNNAIKFTREGSRIVLLARQKDAHVEFGVRDEGVGIPPEEVSRLFGKFVQLDSTLVRRVGGTGLGLYISRNLVEAMGGRIWVESVLGEGSTFKFTLPLKNG
ncbi:MAG: PAS domain S-box protein [Candidatus Omnitrophota bacterium]